MIRPASPADIPAVTQIAHDAYEKYIARIGKKPAPMVADFASIQADGNLWVYEESRAVVGFIVFYPTGNFMHLENVAVSPAHGGKGIGGKLIAFVETRARSEGFTAVELYTNEKMTENQTLYPKLGYTETARREENGFNRVYYSKRV